MGYRKLPFFQFSSWHYAASPGAAGDAPISEESARPPPRRVPRARLLLLPPPPPPPPQRRWLRCRRLPRRHLWPHLGPSPQASKHVSHLKSPSNPDAVRAFVADIGLSKAAADTAVAQHPRILCSKVDKTLTPRIAQLREIALSPPQISRLVAVVPTIFANPICVRRFEFYLSLLGSYDKLHTCLRNSNYLLGYDIETVVKPNLAFLRECGLTPPDLAKVFVLVPRLFCRPRNQLQAVVRRVEEKLGVRQGVPNFRHALFVACCLRQESIIAKVEVLKSLGWRSDQVAEVITKKPSVLHGSEERLRRAMKFFTKEAGMDVEAIAKCPALLKYSIEKRLVPRLNVLKVLREERLPGRRSYDLHSVATMRQFVHPYRESFPAIIDAYADAL